MGIRLKRAYDEPAGSDGFRVLVDRVWPRGVRKEELDFDQWMKDIAPSTQLRKWFNHDPRKWDEFKRRYFKELESHDEDVELLERKAAEGSVTLVFAAKDEQRSNAAALREYLERRRRRL